MSAIDPADILELGDYEPPPRKPDEMRSWWHSKYRQFSATALGRAYAREGKGRRSCPARPDRRRRTGAPRGRSSRAGARRAAWIRVVLGYVN